MSCKKVIMTEAAPAAIGPYSQAISFGDMVFISGQMGVDPAVGKMVSEDVVEQARQALKNVQAILAAAEMDMTDAVKTTVFLADIKDFAAVNDVYANYFTANYPARSCFQVGALPLNAKVEIEVLAYKTKA